MAGALRLVAPSLPCFRLISVPATLGPGLLLVASLVLPHGIKPLDAHRCKDGRQPDPAPALGGIGNQLVDRHRSQCCGNVDPMTCGTKSRVWAAIYGRAEGRAGRIKRVARNGALRPVAVRRYRCVLLLGPTTRPGIIVLGHEITAMVRAQCQRPAGRLTRKTDKNGGGSSRLVSHGRPSSAFSSGLR